MLTDSSIGNRNTIGVDWREILEAVEVGIEMGGGPATVSARFALTVMEEIFPDRAEDRAALNVSVE